MVTFELKKYVKDAYSAGLKEEDIIINLLNNDWDADDVDSAVKDFFSSEYEHELSEKRHSKSKIIISYLLIVFGILLVFLALYIARPFIVELYNSTINNNTKNTASVVAIPFIKKINNNTYKKYSTLLFVGDIMLSKNRGVWKQIVKNRNVEYPFLKIADTLRSADLTFGNLEGPISSRGHSVGNKYSFRDDPIVVKGLKFAGFDIMSVANNHIFDWGGKAFDDTLSILNSNGIDTVGGGVNYTNANIPVIESINGVKIAFLAYSLVDYDKNSFLAEGNMPGKSSFNLKYTARAVRRIKELGIANIVVVSFHWGDEYKTHSNKEQQNIAHVLIESGADIIIGHHPHVVQEVERYKKGWIAYSLGNFVFDQSFSKETMRGLMLDVTINNKSKKIFKVKPIEIKISKTFQPSIFKYYENI